VIEALRPTAVICALGSTWKKAGKDEAAFRAVDQDLVLAVARAAKEHGVERFVSVSSVGADPHAKAFYLKVKGETDRELTKIGIGRLDVLRPGLLRGRRQESRPAEWLAMLASPMINPLLAGKRRAYRAIDAETVARAALYLAMRPARDASSTTTMRFCAPRAPCRSHCRDNAPQKSPAGKGGAFGATRNFCVIASVDRVFAGLAD
jgi:uncharacterized protein YbjT (DUF2867 family)